MCFFLFSFFFCLGFLKCTTSKLFLVEKCGSIILIVEIKIKQKYKENDLHSCYVNAIIKGFVSSATHDNMNMKLLNG